MGGTGERFVLGDATLTRAAIRLHSGTLGYSYVLGRDKAHAERCALIDALLLQQPETRALLQEKIIAPLAALREEQRQLRAAAERIASPGRLLYAGSRR